MSCKQIEVRNLLEEISKRIETCPETFSDQNVSNCLYGLQSMSSEHVEVRKVLTALTVRMQQCSLSPLGAGLCLYGLQGMDPANREVKDILDEVLTQAERVVESGGWTVNLWRTVVLFRHQVAGLPSDVDKRLNKLERYLHVHLADETTPAPMCSTSVETQFLDAIDAQVTARLPGAHCMRNRLLHGFEADCVLQMESGAIVNIEIDGPTHRHPRKRRFCEARDQYLYERHGVVVKRIDLMRLTRMVSRADVNNVVSNTLRNLFSIG